ncbi:MAG: patatin-like phospholipase family protein [Roseiarcus sp.]|jgi:predicted acylesterase/phospholipase RssA
MSDATTTTASARDSHLFAPGAKRILALDGGGVRGIVALAFLKKIERTLEAEAGKFVRLCDYFDLIGGTSTGAIIAVGLALGYNVDQIREFYLRLAPRVFRPPWVRVPGWRAIFDARALAGELKAIIGDRTLDTPDLQTGLGVMLKRIDTASAWILTNNPRSAYWETPPDHSFIGNRNYRLAEIVRASTAAPHYFDPQEIEIVAGEPPGLFVDGGLTPHNNPSLALFLSAFVPHYGLAWEASPEKLTIVSIGAGTFRDRLDSRSLSKGPSAKLALRAMIQQIGDNQQLILTLMSLLGESPTAWPINSEIGDLGAVPAPRGPLFRFLRYDMKLEAQWFAAALGETPTEKQIAQMRRLDDAGSMPLLEALARRAAEIQIRREDWAPPAAAP